MDKTFWLSFLFAAVQVILIRFLIKSTKEKRPILTLLLLGGKGYLYYRAVEHIIYNDIFNIEKYIFGFISGVPIAAIIIFLYIAFVGLPLATSIKRCIYFIAPYVIKFIEFLKSLWIFLLYGLSKLVSKKAGK